MKNCTLLSLLLIVLTIEKLDARTLFFDERLYPEVEEFRSKFMSFILNEPIDSLQEAKIAEIIGSVLQLISDGRRLVYDRIQLYSTNFAFLAIDKLFEKTKCVRNEAFYTKAEIFQAFLKAFKRVEKTVDSVLKLNVMDCTAPEAVAPKPNAVSSDNVNDDYGLFRLFTSLLKDGASVESSGSSYDSHMIGKEFEKALPAIINNNIISPSVYSTHSFNIIKMIRDTTNNLQQNLQSSKLFYLVFRFNIPADIANGFVDCFVKSVASIKELSLFNVSYISDVLVKDHQITTFNNTTQFYASMFSKAVSKFIRKYANEMDLNFRSLILSLPKRITNAFSDNFFHGCSDEKLNAKTSANIVENYQNFFELSQSQLEFTFNITHKLIKISEAYSNKHKGRILLALKLTLFSLTKTFNIPDNVFLAVFKKSLALFDGSSFPEIFLTFTVLDIMQTLNGMNSFQGLNSSTAIFKFARILVQRFRENFENQSHEEQNSEIIDLQQENSINLKLPLEIDKKTSVDFAEMLNRPLEISKNSDIFLNETIHKKWHGISLVFAKKIYNAIFLSKLFHDVLYYNSKYVSQFCSCVITYSFFYPLKLDSYEILTLADIFTEIISSYSGSKEKFAQNFAIQIAYWFDFNGLLSKYDIFTLSTSIVDIVLKYVRSCNNLKPNEDNFKDNLHKRDVDFPTQTDNGTKMSLTSSKNSDFKQQRFFPSINMGMESKGHRPHHIRKREAAVQNENDASILVTSSSNSIFERKLLFPSVEMKEESSKNGQVKNHLHKRDAAFSIQIDNVTSSPPQTIYSKKFKQNHSLLDINVNSNKSSTQANSFNKETLRSDKANNSKSLMSLKDSFKSLLYYNLISSSVFKEVMHNNIGTSCAIIYAQEIARVLLKNSPWSALNETSIISALTENFPSKTENHTALDFVDIFSNRISDIAEKFSLIDKNRLNDVATATANSITSYFTKRVSGDSVKSGNRNLCKSDIDLGMKSEEKFHTEMSLVNHTLLNHFKYKVNGTFLLKEFHKESHPKVNADANLTDILSAKFSSILHKNLVSSDKFLKAFYDGLPLPVASAYAFSMAKSLASCSELQAIDETDFSLAFEAALNQLWNHKLL
ncbi:hypothetical protein HNY73_010471 [Argiope bruennichi]|uniref:Uncharacterized protein n=1 Tax=Argiope bruennichi TaxID=94029 RepID=A0A8T0F3J3_ARGBR|nr:hypothetical protein HNY73_010471 [Argiope bruennichi]